GRRRRAAVLLAPLPVTLPDASAFVIVPLLEPTSPPTILFDPTLTAAPVAETLLIVPAFVPASVPTNWEPRPLTVTSARLRLRTTPAPPMLPNSPTFWAVDAIVTLAMVWPWPSSRPVNFSAEPASMLRPSA